MDTDQREILEKVVDVLGEVEGYLAYDQRRIYECRRRVVEVLGMPLTRQALYMEEKPLTPIFYKKYKLDHYI